MHRSSLHECVKCDDEVRSKFLYDSHMHRKHVRLKYECPQHDLSSKIKSTSSKHKEYQSSVDLASKLFILGVFHVHRPRSRTRLTRMARQDETKSTFITRMRCREMLFFLATLCYLFLLTTRFLSVEGLTLVSIFGVNTREDLFNDIKEEE